MGYFNGVGSNGTILTDEVFTHVKVTHFAIGVASRPIDSPLIVIPNTSRAVGVAERRKRRHHYSTLGIGLETFQQPHPQVTPTSNPVGPPGDRTGASAFPSDPRHPPNGLQQSRVLRCNLAGVGLESHSPPTLSSTRPAVVLITGALKMDPCRSLHVCRILVTTGDHRAQTQ